MSECTSFRADLDAFRDGLLDEERSQQLQRHVESCDSCRAQAKQAEAIEAGIRANAAQWLPPDYLWTRIQSSADELDSVGQRRSYRKAFVMGGRSDAGSCGCCGWF